MEQNEWNTSLTAHQRFYTRLLKGFKIPACPNRITRNLFELESRLRGFESALGYKYSPAQPRIPSGNPHGGEWTSGGYAGGVTPTGIIPNSPTTSGDEETGTGVSDKPTRGATDDTGIFGDGTDVVVNNTFSLSNLFDDLFDGSAGDLTDNDTIEGESGDDTLGGGSGDDTDKLDPHQISYNDGGDPNSAAAKQVNIFIGGAADETINGPVLSSGSLENSVGTNYYYTRDDQDIIDAKIANLPDGTYINVISHSNGASTASYVATDNPGKVQILMTVDPAAYLSPDYSDIKNSVTSWLNINATGKPDSGNFSNFIAQLGDHWGTGPQNYATAFFNVPLNHGDFNQMMNYPLADGLTAQKIINRK